MLKTLKYKFIQKALLAALIFFMGMPPDLTAAASSPSIIPAEDVDNFGPIGKLMFWNVPEKIAGFRNIDKLYDTRTVSRGDQIYPLIAAPADLSGITYEYKGKTYTVDDYLKQKNVCGLSGYQRQPHPC